MHYCSRFGKVPPEVLVIYGMSSEFIEGSLHFFPILFPKNWILIGKCPESKCIKRKIESSSLTALFHLLGHYTDVVLLNRDFCRIERINTLRESQGKTWFGSRSFTLPRSRE